VSAGQVLACGPDCRLHVDGGRSTSGGRLSCPLVRCWSVWGRWSALWAGRVLERGPDCRLHVDGGRSTPGGQQTVAALPTCRRRVGSADRPWSAFSRRRWSSCPGWSAVRGGRAATVYRIGQTVATLPPRHAVEMSADRPSSGRRRCRSTTVHWHGQRQIYPDHLSGHGTRPRTIAATMLTCSGVSPTRWGQIDHRLRTTARGHACACTTTTRPGSTTDSATVGPGVVVTFGREPLDGNHWTGTSGRGYLASA